MAWEEKICPLHYTPIAQIIISIVIGIIFSYLTYSFAILLIFYLIYELYYWRITTSYDEVRWGLMVRLGVIAGGLTGWIIGRAVLNSESSFITMDYDHALGIKLISGWH